MHPGRLDEDPAEFKIRRRIRFLIRFVIKIGLFELPIKKNTEQFLTNRHMSNPGEIL